MIELSRWGLPSTDAITRDPNLLALIDGYSVTLERIENSFLRCRLPNGEPLPPADQFFEDLARERGAARSFRAIQAEAQMASGLSENVSADSAYERFSEWMPFHRRPTAVVESLRHFLGYDE